MSLVENLTSPQTNSISPEEWEMRVDLAAAHRLADREGWQDEFRIFMHFAARVPGEPDQMLVKRHDLLFSEVCASNLVKVDMNGAPQSFKQNVNPAGFAIHASVLRARPDLNASLHLHSNAIMALTALAGGLKFVTQEGMRFYNRISYHEFEGIAEVDEGPRLAKDLGKNDAMIMRNHGVLVCGPTMDTATLDLGRLVRMADVQLRLMASGGEIAQPSAEICESTAQMYAGGSKHNRIEWNAALRLLDRHDPSYRD